MATEEVNKSQETDATENKPSPPSDPGGAGGATRAGTKEDIRSDTAQPPAPDNPPPDKLRNGT